MKKTLVVVTLASALALLLAPALFAQWEPDSRLTYDPAESYTSTKSNGRSVAVSGDTVHVVWYDYRDTYAKVYYKRSLDGGNSWEPDLRLADLTTGNSAQPCVAVWGSKVYVVWVDNRDGYESEVYYDHSTNGGMTWAGNERFSHSNNRGRNPSIAVLGSHIHVVWEDNRGLANPEIYQKYSNNGGQSWSAEENITNETAYSRAPSVALFGTIVHVAWEDGRDRGAIYYKQSPDGGQHWNPDIALFIEYG